MDGRRLTTGLILALMTMNAWAGTQVRLTPVWSRVADINGEYGSIESAEFSPDGNRIVSGSKFDNQVIMWRTSDGMELWRATVAQEIERVAWSMDGKYVCSVSEDFLLSMFDASDGKLIKTVRHLQGIDALAASPDGRFMVSGEENTEGEDGKTHGWVRVFSMPELEQVKLLDHGEIVNEIHFTSDSKYMLTAGHPDKVMVWDTTTWEEVTTLRGEPDKIFVTAQFSPDDSMIAASGRTGDVYVWDWRKGKVLSKFNHTGRKTESLAWSPDGHYMVTSGNDFHLMVYRVKDILSGHKIPIAHKTAFTDGTEYVHFNQRGTHLVSAHQDGLIRLWVFMTDDPTINERRHEEVKRIQRQYALERQANE